MYMRLAIALFLAIFCVSVHATSAVSRLQLSGLAIRYDQGDLSVLNQQKLPAEEEWLAVETTEQMVEIITSLKVRGAPLIGIAAILSLPQLAEKGESRETIEKAAALLRSSRPTAVNLSCYIDRLLGNPEECLGCTLCRFTNC